ncbi:hypothetical protein GOBAR_AA02511 [Gossypium barbadense]|uniref:Uncharacterized protein n=1 Tax=Gossypium barbadense TaxID=3634 RepID=A0A2P5YR31_GOSBA|nr:hypothetical protein GOBAR_AA02511 [Gossypium barbadense]
MVTTPKASPTFPEREGHEPPLPKTPVLSWSLVLTSPPPSTTHRYHSVVYCWSWVSTTQDVLNLVVYWDIWFSRGKFNGSFISMFWRNLITRRDVRFQDGQRVRKV